MNHWDIQQIIKQLTRIANALEKVNSAQDFSKEDASVLTTTQNIKDAQGRIPPTPTPNKGT